MKYISLYCIHVYSSNGVTIKITTQLLYVQYFQTINADDTVLYGYLVCTLHSTVQYSMCMHRQ